MKHKYLECTFYWIEIDEDGDKIVRPYGQIYDGEDSPYEDEPDLTYRFETLDLEFLVDDMDDEDFSYSELVCTAYKDIDDINEKEALRLLNNGLDVENRPPIELPLTKITKDTPCGWYVNYPYPVYKKF